MFFLLHPYSLRILSVYMMGTWRRVSVFLWLINDTLTGLVKTKRLFVLVFPDWSLKVVAPQVLIHARVKYTCNP